MTTGRLKEGILARMRFAIQILKNSHTAQTADWDELYGSGMLTAPCAEDGEEVWRRAWTEDQTARRDMADAMQMKSTFRIKLWVNLSRGRIATARTEMVDMR